MNFTYLPMGSMQLGPNGELIPTSIPSSIAAGRVQPTYHAVAAAPPNGSTHNWKMTDLAPLYTAPHGHSFAVMDPLSSGHATMVPMAVAGEYALVTRGKRPLGRGRRVDELRGEL